MSEYRINKDALIEQLEQNRTNSIKFLWRSGGNNPSLRDEVTSRVSLLELAIDELKSGNKEPAEVTSYFENLVQEELKALNDSLENKKEAANTTPLKKLIKIITKSKIGVA